MAVTRWDSTSGAFAEPASVPKRYDAVSGAWVETTGMAWEAESQAWTERWSPKVTAYVYGAASETVTVKKNGIIVATVSTDSSGQSTEQIELVRGTYTLTGSVSGHTEEQTVDGNTTKFMAMPEGALYWYGNMCTFNVVEDSYPNTTSFTVTHYTNSVKVQRGSGAYSNTRRTLKLDTTKYSKFKALIDSICTGSSGGTAYVTVFTNDGTELNIYQGGGGYNVQMSPQTVYEVESQNLLYTSHSLSITGGGSYFITSAVWFE